MAVSNTSSNVSSMAQLASDVANMAGFSTLLIFEIILSVTAIVPNLLLLYVLTRVRIFPINLRLLLGHLGLNLIWQAAAFWFKSVYTFTILTEHRYEQFVTSSYMCKLSELTNTIPMQNSVYTSLGLCLERVYSTVRYKHYDKEHSKPYLASVVIPMAWAISLANQLNILYNIDHADSIPICESLLSATPSSALITLILSSIVETICVVLALVVYKWNNSKLKSITMNRAQTTLGARFQLSQNVEINSIVLPVMILQAICFAPNYLFLSLIIFKSDQHNFKLPLRVLMIHINYVWKLCFCLACPLLAFNRKARLLDHLKKRTGHQMGLTTIMYRLRNKINPHETRQKDADANDAVDTTHAHFEALKQIWAVQAAYYYKDKYREENDG